MIKGFLSCSRKKQTLSCQISGCLPSKVRINAGAPFNMGNGVQSCQDRQRVEQPWRILRWSHPLVAGRSLLWARPPSAVAEPKPRPTVSSGPTCILECWPQGASPGTAPCLPKFLFKVTGSLAATQVPLHCPWMDLTRPPQPGEVKEGLFLCFPCDQDAPAPQSM